MYPLLFPFLLIIMHLFAFFFFSTIFLISVIVRLLVITNLDPARRAPAPDHDRYHRKMAMPHQTEQMRVWMIRL